MRACATNTNIALAHSGIPYDEEVGRIEHCICNGGKLILFKFTFTNQRECKMLNVRVYWLTQENNERARKLYDKVAQQTGFIQYKKSL